MLNLMQYLSLCINREGKLLVLRNRWLQFYTIKMKLRSHEMWIKKYKKKLTVMSLNCFFNDYLVFLLLSALNEHGNGKNH